MNGQEQGSYQPHIQMGNSAALIILKSLSEMVRLLDLMLHEERVVAEKFERFSQRYASPTLSDESLREFGQIYERLWNFETMLSCAARTALVMAVLDIQTTLNRFCVNNIGTVTTEAIRELPLDAQMEVAHRTLGVPEEFRSTPQYHALRELITWHENFSRGTIPDVPAPSIYENNITTPGRYPNPGDEVHQLREYLRHYLVVQHHLLRINEHPFLAYNSSGLEEIEQRLSKIRTFQFSDGRLVDRVDPT